MRLNRKAINFIEIILAVTILALATVPVLTLALGTSKQAQQVSSIFKEAILAQLLCEAFKSRIAINPYFLKELVPSYSFEETSWVSPQGKTYQAAVLTASVWDENPAPLDERDRPIRSAFLTHYLFNHKGSGTKLYVPDNQGSLTPALSTVLDSNEIESLRQNYSGLAYRITVVDGPHGEMNRSGPVTNYRVARNDETKSLRIDIFRTVRGTPIPDTPVFGFETVLETPPESLSLKSLKRRQDVIGASGFLGSAAENLMTLRDSSQKRFTGALMETLSVLSLLISEAVNESVRIEGDDLGLNVQTRPPQTLDSWIQSLSRQTATFAKLQQSKLEEQRSLIIYGAFRRSDEPIKKLYELSGECHSRGKALIEQMQTRIKAAEAAAATTGTTVVVEVTDSPEDPFRKALEFLREPMFWVVLSEHDSCQRVFARPPGWAERFETAMKSGLTVRKGIASDTRPPPEGPTPLEAVVNMKAYVELCKALKLYKGEDQPAFESLVDTARKDSLDGLLPFSEYLAQDNLKNMPDLMARNEQYAGTKRGLADLAASDGPYAQFSKLVSTGFSPMIQTIANCLSRAGLTANVEQLKRDVKGDVEDSLSANITISSGSQSTSTLATIRDILVRAQETTKIAELQALQSELTSVSTSLPKLPQDTPERRLIALVGKFILQRIERVTADE